MRVTSIFKLIVIVPILSLYGCATAPPLSQFENSLITKGPQMASVVIYRSTEESLIHRVFIDVHVDEHPFMQLIRGEYIQIYLPVGRHMIKVDYPRYSVASHDTEDQKMIDLKPGDVLYMEIVPSFEGWTWACAFTYFPICLPMPGPKVDLFLKTKEDAQKAMGKAVDRELLRERRIIQH